MWSTQCEQIIGIDHGAWAYLAAEEDAFGASVQTILFKGVRDFYVSIASTIMASQTSDATYSAQVRLTPITKADLLPQVDLEAQADLPPQVHLEAQADFNTVTSPLGGPSRLKLTWGLKPLTVT